VRRIWHAAASHPRAPLVGQFVKFGIVGIANTLLTLGVYTVLLKVLGLYYVAASGVGFTVGTVNSFLLNRRWTFREHKGDALTPVRWFTVQGSGLLVDLGLVYVLVEGVRIGTLVGQAIAIAIVVVLTFFANRAWTFRMRPSAN
jgi:putative flippase GtrA